MNNPQKPWETLKSNIILNNPWMEVHQDSVKTSKGREILYTWYLSQDVSIVVPYIDNDTLLMINQYRYPLNKTFLEFPAGHIESDEDPQKTALRELEEETGYKAKKSQLIYKYHPSVSKSKQTVYIFRAEELVKGHMRPDGAEDIAVVKVAKNDLYKMICERKIENAATLIAYFICCNNNKY